jgi:hypothetical protein
MIPVVPAAGIMLFGDQEGSMKLAALTVAAAVALAGTANASDIVVKQLEKSLDVPAKVAWERIGGFCMLDQWFDGMKCTLKNGKGEPGTVRVMESKMGGGEEVAVARTNASYTYTMVKPMLPMYHGTLAVEPTGARTSKIVYTLFWDQEPVPADQRDKARDGLVATFTPLLDKMKATAEKK